MAASASEDRTRILAEAETKAGKAKKETTKASAKAYVKTMKRVIERGVEYVHKEIERVGILLKKEQMSSKQLKNFKRRRNILSVFVNADPARKKAEAKKPSSEQAVDDAGAEL